MGYFGSHVTTFHQLCVAVEHFELGSLTLPPETDIEFVPTYAKIANRYVRQPFWEQRIDIQFVPWRIGQEPQHGLRQHEDRSGRPGLRHIRADILHRKRRLIARKGSVELRQLVQQKMTRSDADVVRDPPRLRAEAIELEPHRDDPIVMRPYRSSLIVVRIECRISGRERADTPS